MKLLNLLVSILYTLTLISATLTNSGCAKEYSFERQLQDSVIIRDSTPPPPLLLSACLLCANANSVKDSTWSFKLEGATFCGLAEKAIITLDRNAFTFFGPSACSADSGFIASVYLNEPLNSSQTNITAARVAFYYYDGLTPSYVLISRNTDPFSLLIENYVHQTGIATGSFKGFAYTDSGIRKVIEGGRFRIKFP